MLVARRIEEWFKRHDGKGDFACRAADLPYLVISPKQNRGATIFTTKAPSVIAAIDHRQMHERFGLIGGGGLPNRDHLNFFRRIIGSRSLLFLGDLDPPDLMVFAWLRNRLPAMRISYLGISDALLTHANASPPEQHRIPLSRNEQEAMELLPTVFPDFQATVGDECAHILSNNEKLEVEALVQGKKAGAAILAASFGDQ